MNSSMTMARSGPVGIGFIGPGMISTTYLENLTRFPDVKVCSWATSTQPQHRPSGSASRSEQLSRPVDPRVLRRLVDTSFLILVLDRSTSCR